MKKKSTKKKSKIITTGEDVVVNSDQKVCNLFKTKPELSIGWIGEDGDSLTDPDEINDFIKRERMPEKEKSLLKNKSLKNKIVDGKITKKKAVTEIKNKLRRMKEQKAMEDFKKPIKNDTYQGDGTEWIIEKAEDGTFFRRMMGSDKSEKVK